jgi:hypothetical protein
MTLSIGTGAAGVVSGNSVRTITTASFSPPGNALLVALATGNMDSLLDCALTAVTSTGTAMATAWTQQAHKSLRYAFRGLVDVMQVPPFLQGMLHA